MKARFNPTGTHIHRGFLKVRIDLYPDIGDKTYLMHHIQVPVFPKPDEEFGGYVGEIHPDGTILLGEEGNSYDVGGQPVDIDDYNNWIDGLPKVWQLNPALCHFITIDQDTTLASLDGIVRGIFDKETLDQLDDILSKPDTSQVRQVMRSKLGIGKKLSIGGDNSLIDNLNTRFASLEIT